MVLSAICSQAQTIRNARAQGALITHNHPGWERKSTDYTKFEKGIYADGLIDGIEVTNGRSFYPKIVRRAVEKKLYMVSATDIHATTASIFGKQNFYRDMTLIFAKDKMRSRCARLCSIARHSVTAEETSLARYRS